MKQVTKKNEEAKNGTSTLTISKPNLRMSSFKIRGKTPYCQNKFSAKAKEQIRITQEAGSTGKKNIKKVARDFKANFEGAKHIAEDGWYGIPAPGIRAALVSACRVCGFTMTRAKLSIFVEPDGFDVDDETPLVKITKGKPKPFDIDRLDTVRNESGVIDLRARPKWKSGWEAIVRITFDADQFTVEDVANLLLRAGLQVGIGEGRPDSKKSTGMGWGLFEVIQQ